MTRALILLALLLPADITPRGEPFRPPSARLMGTLKLGDRKLSSFAYSRDGRRVTVLTTDGEMLVFDVSTRRQLRKIPGTFNVNRFQVSSDGKRALAGIADRRSLRLVDLETGEEIRTFADSLQLSCSQALSPDGRQVAYLRRSDQSVRLYDAKSGDELRTLSEAGARSALAWSPNGRVLAMHGADSTVRFLDTDSWELKGSYGDRSPQPLYLGFTPDSSALVHVGLDAKLKIVDTSGRLLKTFEESITGSRHVAFSRDGGWMAVAEAQNKVRIYETKTWKAVRDLEAPSSRHLAFSPDGRHLALGMENGIQLWGGAGPSFAVAPGDGTRDGAPGFLGIMGSPTDDEEAGVIIENILPGTAAEKAGLKAGDRIVKIGGGATDTFEALRTTVTTLREGDEVEVVYLRDGVESRVKVKLGSRPSE